MNFSHLQPPPRPKRDTYNGRDGNGYQPRPPEPPPMRIGQHGDTIDRQGVRRKADGSLRNFTMDRIRWVGLNVFVVVAAIAAAKFLEHWL